MALDRKGFAKQMRRANTDQYGNVVCSWELWGQIANLIEMEDGSDAADVVEVVRCKDCVHAYNIGAERCSCDCIDSYYNQVGLNHFCSSGERRPQKETVRCNDCEYYDKGMCFHNAVNYVARDRDFSCDFGERKKQKERGEGDGDAE